jgi:nucleotide-binding universal stress UspA family protein
VTDHLVRELRVPVCVIRPVDEVTPLPAPALRRVVVPLDGSARAEEALPIAVDLARALGISLLLLHVAPRPDETLRVGGEPVVDRWAAVLFEAAAAYLDERRGRLDSGALVVETAVRVGEPAEVILQEVTGGGDLLVMATHGRTGLTRWALGSIADKVVRAGEAPVILVRSRGRGGVLLFRASQPHGTGERRTP